MTAPRPDAAALAQRLERDVRQSLSVAEGHTIAAHLRRLAALEAAAELAEAVLDEMTHFADKVRTVAELGAYVDRIHAALAALRAAGVGGEGRE